MQLCNKCNQEFPLDNFYKRNEQSFKRICKKCCNNSRSEEETKLYNSYAYEKRKKERRDPAYQARNIYYDSRKFDKKRNLEHNLSIEDIQKLLDVGNCSYCGELNLRLSLDRIDNSKGHTSDNVITACYRCNLLRRDMPYDAWLHMVPIIKEIREMSLFADWTAGIKKHQILIRS